MFGQEPKAGAEANGGSPVARPDPARLAGNAREEGGRRKGEQRSALRVNAN